MTRHALFFLLILCLSVAIALDPYAVETESAQAQTPPLDAAFYPIFGAAPMGIGETAVVAAGMAVLINLVIVAWM